MKLVEAGNVSMTTGSSLIRGATSLFGFKTKLQFGKLTATALVSQQNSESRTVIIAHVEFKPVAHRRAYSSLYLLVEIKIRLPARIQSQSRIVGLVALHAHGNYIIHTRLGETDLVTPFMLTRAQYEDWQLRRSMEAYEQKKCDIYTVCDQASHFRYLNN